MTVTTPAAACVTDSEGNNKLSGTNSDRQRHRCQITAVLSADETLQQVRSRDKHKQMFGSRAGVHGLRT